MPKLIKSEIDSERVYFCLLSCFWAGIPFACAISVKVLCCSTFAVIRERYSKSSSVNFDIRVVVGSDGKIDGYTAIELVVGASQSLVTISKEF